MTMITLASLQDQAEEVVSDTALFSDAYGERKKKVRVLVGDAFELGVNTGGEPSGSDYTEGAGPDDDCGCGERITWFEGEWMHIINPQLRGTDDHTAEPGGGFYEPDEEGL